MHVHITSGIALSVVAFTLSSALADIAPVAPKEGETVEQLTALRERLLEPAK